MFQGGDLLIVNKPQILTEQQKGYRKGTKGTGDLLYYNQLILKDCKTRRKNLVMVWSDYKKAYDVILQSWIIDCLEMYKES